MAYYLYTEFKIGSLSFIHRIGAQYVVPNLSTTINSNIISQPLYLFKYNTMDLNA